MKMRAFSFCPVVAVLLIACGDKAVQESAPPQVESSAELKVELLHRPEGKALSHSAPLPANLVIKVKKEGAGEAIAYGQTGRFHLQCSTSSGLQFQNTLLDSSGKGLGQPVPLFLGQGGGYDGMALGLMGMKVGEVRSLSIPPELAFGAGGNPSLGVPGHASLWVRAEYMGLAESSLEVVITQEGSGPSLAPQQQGKFHYTGVLARNGQQFDSSRDRGEPTQFGLHQVIQGWTLGLHGIKAGEKRWLRIPSHLAYGANGAGKGSPIGPNEDLIFEVELVELVND